MTVEPSSISGVLFITPRVFEDSRGSFHETYRRERYADAGIAVEFVQDNLSFSRGKVLRGLHAQFPNPQGKLVQCVSGSVFDVAVDIRAGSPDFGRWVGIELSAENRRQIYIPPGLAHGFSVLSESAVVYYKVTTAFDATGDFTIRWDDPDIGIEWPIDGEPVLSSKDSSGCALRNVPSNKLLQFGKDG
jgi:dTDP-4-dehydrorhamnose 3,5-epimerase